MTNIHQASVNINIGGKNFVVQGPTIAKFPTDPANNTIQTAKEESTGDVKYKTPAEIA